MVLVADADAGSSILGLVLLCHNASSLRLKGLFGLLKCQLRQPRSLFVAVLFQVKELQLVLQAQVRTQHTVSRGHDRTAVPADQNDIHSRRNLAHATPATIVVAVKKQGFPVLDDAWTLEQAVDHLGVTPFAGWLALFGKLVVAKKLAGEVGEVAAPGLSERVG